MGADRKSLTPLEGRRLARFAVPLCLFGHLALTLPLAALLNLWLDEAYSLHTTERGITHAIEQAIRFEVQPPLYFILLTAWRWVSSSLFWVRLFSVACAAVRVGAATRLSRRWFPTRHPAWLTAVVAFHPLLIWAAVEARVYALAIFLSALSLLWFFDGYLAETPRRRARWGYGAVVVAGVYSQYYLGFLFAAQACALCALRRWRALGDYLKTVSIVGLCASPLLFIVAAQLSTQSAALQGDIAPAEAVRFMFGRAAEFALPAEWSPLESLRGGVLLGGVVLVAVWRWVKGRGADASSVSAAWVMTITLTFCLALVLVHLGWKELMGRRHAVGLFLPMLLAVFGLMATAPKRGLLPLWSALSLCFCLLSLAAMYRPLAKLGDWGRVARYIESAEQPGQLIVVFPGESAVGLSYYYRGDNPIAPLPRGASFESYDERRYVVHGERDIIATLTSRADEPSSLWLVTFDFADCSFLGVNFGCQVVDEFIAAYYTIETTRQFFGARARLLRRKPDTAFPLAPPPAA